MKAKGITYKQVAKALDISLSTVKRDFALKNLSLSRFLAICEITKTSLKDLSQSIEKSQPKTHVLTDEQERFFSKNINPEFKHTQESKKYCFRCTLNAMKDDENI